MTLLAVFDLFGMILVFVVAVGVGVAGIMIKRGTMSTKVFRLMNKGGKESFILLYLCPSAYSFMNKPSKKQLFVQTFELRTLKFGLYYPLIYYYYY